MRLAFWRAGKEAVDKDPLKPMPVSFSATVTPEFGDLDLRSVARALVRTRGRIILPTVLAAVLSITVVNIITPRYKSEARILIDGRENVFLRPNGERSEERSALDAEAVTSQVQLLLSRDLARDIIRKNNLSERPEFDPVLEGISPLKSLLALIGIGRDPFSLTPEERVLDAYYDRLTAYAVDKSRVVVIEFQSRDPELAARVANSIAEGYLELLQAARRDQAKMASQWLSGEIENLRRKVAEAESRAEDFRSKSSLFVGTNNTTLSNQEMGELNTQLNHARALKSDAEAKAQLIREMLQGGKPIEASEVLNSELIRRLSEQRVTLRAQLAEQSSTLLDNHPRIKEMKAQLADLDRQLREEASKISRSLDNDARIAGGRVEALSASLEQSKKLASSTNGQDVQLRALEREAKAQRDLLESYLAKYREANTRENIEATPADGRIISRASVSNSPAYPKKLPIVLIATLATLMLWAGAIATGELLRLTEPRAVAAFASTRPTASAPSARAASVAAVERAPGPEPASEGVPEAGSEPATELEPVPAASAPSAQTFSDFTEIERLVGQLRDPGAVARKITVLGAASNESTAWTTLSIARLLARSARVVLVNLAPSSSTVSAMSADPTAPGLAELMLGEASFAHIITRDRLSRLHLVSAGRPGADRSMLQSPRLGLAIDAFLRVYDHVLLDAGTASDLPSELLTAQARAVVVPDGSMAADARALMCDQLRAAGFSEVTMLDQAAQPFNATDPVSRVVAA
jgi:polysaccharide biosynthesis transport protein